MASDMGVEYRLSGTGGHAPSTLAGKASAIAHFNAFLITKRMMAFEVLTEPELCRIELWQQFGTYLSEVAVSNRTKELLSWGTAKQFLSGPKSCAESKFPGNIMWVNQDWYTKIRLDIEKTIVRRCIELGIPVEEKSEPIGRELLLVLNDVILGMVGSADQTKAIEYRAALNTSFLAIGRGGECGFSSFNLARWDSVYQCLFLLWVEKKTNAQKPMNFFCDAKCWEIDFNHSMACYFVLGAGSSWFSSVNSIEDKWMFPFLETDGASKKMTDYMRKLAPFTNGKVPLDVSATSLRVGGVAEVVNRTGDIVAATIRGGWGGFLASVATMMEYYIGSHHTLSVGGRSISAWPHPQKHVHAPSCDVILAMMSPHECGLFDNFLSQLFMCAHFQVMQSHLKGFGYCMFASLVQYLPEFIDKCSEQHVVVVALFRVARQFKYSKATLLEWGTAIASDWSLKNIINVEKESDLGPVISKMQEELIKIKTQNCELLLQQKQLLAQNTLILELLRQSTPLEQIYSPGNKRARELLSDPVLSTGLPTDDPPVPPVLVTKQPPDRAPLTPPSPVLMIDGGSPVFELYRVWFQRGLTLEKSSLLWDTIDRRDKHRVRKAIYFSNGLLKDNPHIAMSLTRAPQLDDANFAEWSREYTRACTSLVECVIVQLNALDGKKSNSAPTVNAVGNRAPPLPKNMK